MNYLRLLVMSFFLLFLASCGDSTGPGGEGCSDITFVTVGSGTTPTFDWSPNCTVAQVVVTDIDQADVDLQVRWAVTAEQNVIRPPVTFGTPPTGALETVPEKALVTGHRHLLDLYVHDLTSGLPVQVVRFQFTP